MRWRSGATSAMRARRRKKTWSGARAIREYTRHANAKTGNFACELRNEDVRRTISTIVRRARSKGNKTSLGVKTLSN
eukprot:6180708-Pleurochrysis_carterae.AAC.4